MTETVKTGRSWHALYLLGAAVALVAVVALLFDIVLSMLPGWGTDTTPAIAREWLALFAANPLLGLRNLDLLNVTVSIITLPMYLALYAAHRRSEPALALLGFVLVAVGTTLFASSNAALPMLSLSNQYALATTAAERLAVEAAAAGLLVRGAHGSFGAFPGFLLSEVGTLVVALAMLRGRVFGRVTAWLGILGASALVLYSIAMTFTTVSDSLVVAFAAPGGLLLIAWQVLVARGLRTLSQGSEDAVATATPALAKAATLG